MPWVMSSEPIFASSIPVLKMEIDPIINDDIGKINLSEDQIKELKKKKYRNA